MKGKGQRQDWAEEGQSLGQPGGSLEVFPSRSPHCGPKWPGLGDHASFSLWRGLRLCGSSAETNLAGANGWAPGSGDHLCEPATKILLSRPLTTLADSSLTTSHLFLDILVMPSYFSSHRSHAFLCLWPLSRISFLLIHSHFS